MAAPTSKSAPGPGGVGPGRQVGRCSDGRRRRALPSQPPELNSAPGQPPGLGKPLPLTSLGEAPPRVTVTVKRCKVLAPADDGENRAHSTQTGPHTCMPWTAQLSPARLLRTRGGTSAELPTICGLCNQLEKWKSTAKCLSVWLIQLSKLGSHSLLPNSCGLSLSAAAPRRDVDAHNPLI